MRDTTEDLNDMLVNKPTRKDGTAKRLTIISTSPIDDKEKELIMLDYKRNKLNKHAPRRARKMTGKKFNITLKYE